MKCCTKCKVEKLEGEFYLNRQTRDKLASWCKMCATNLAKKCHLENPEKARQATKKWYLKNPEKARLQKKTWKFENPEKARQATKKWYLKNPEKARQKAKNWRLKHPEWESRPDRKIYRAMKCRIYGALKSGWKSARTAELLGCPIVWLEVHLESQFRPGMTWENYGPVWHIDHVRPCASFDLTNPEHQRMCFHWTNLQPLFAAENLSKGAKYER